MINYVIGDATDPRAPGNQIIAHIVNNEGGWGKGFVVPLAERYPGAKTEYKRWHKRGSCLDGPFELGNVQFAAVKLGTLTNHDWIYVANMVAQDGYRKNYDDPPERYVDYFYLGLCLEKVARFALKHEASVHMPRIGCGLGGGDWAIIEDLIEDYLGNRDVAVTVYDPR